MRAGDVVGGRYHLMERVGTGSYGVVWRAEERVRAEVVSNVAVKEFTTQANLSEMQVLARLSHPNILVYRATVEESGRLFLVTEFADGGSTAQWLGAYPRGVPVALVQSVLQPIASALSYLHGLGLVHRDIKPANILLVGDRARLGDVQTVKAVHGSVSRHSGAGTVAYAAPEMFEEKVGPKSDVYSFGVTAFELLTGRLPFDGSPAAIMRAHLAEKPPIPDAMPPIWKLIIAGCLEKDPTRRWSAEQVHASLGAGTHEDTSASGGRARIGRAIEQYLDSVGEGWAQSQHWRPFWEAIQADAHRSGMSAGEISAQVRVAFERRSEESRSNEFSSKTHPAHPGKQERFALDQEIDAYLDQNGTAWSDGTLWNPFFHTIEEKALTWGYGEREILARIEQRIDQRARLAERRQKMRHSLVQWLAAQPGGRVDIRDWMRFCDGLTPAEEKALAADREVLLPRVFPASTGVSREVTFDFGGFSGRATFTLVYLPLASIPAARRLVGSLVEQLADEGHAKSTPLRGFWVSPVVTTALVQSLRPMHQREDVLAGTLARATLAEARDVILPRLRQLFPLEEFRLPTADELAAVRALQERSRGPRQTSKPAPKTFWSALGRGLEAVAAEIEKERSEWCDDSDTPASPAERRPFRVVSPVPAPAGG